MRSARLQDGRALVVLVAVVAIAPVVIYALARIGALSDPTVHIEVRGTAPPAPRPEFVEDATTNAADSRRAGERVAVDPGSPLPAPSPRRGSPRSLREETRQRTIEDLFERLSPRSLSPLDIATTSCEGHRLVVHIQGEAGKSESIAGATVGLVTEESRRFLLGTTGLDGRVVFEGLPAGAYRVNAECDGYLRAGIERLCLDRDQMLRMELETAKPIPVLVEDEQGRPIPGARLFTGNVHGEFEPKQSREVGRTNAHGLFRFAFESEGKRSVLFVLSEGHGMAKIVPEDAGPSRPALVRLAPGRVLRGKVVDPGGRPIAGVSINLEVSFEKEEVDDLEVVLETDAAGTFRFPHLPDGEVWLEADADGCESEAVEFEERGSLSEVVKNFKLGPARNRER